MCARSVPEISVVTSSGTDRIVVKLLQAAVDAGQSSHDTEVTLSGHTHTHGHTHARIHAHAQGSIALFFISDHSPPPPPPLLCITGSSEAKV